MGQLVLEKHVRVVGTDRLKLQTDLVGRYADGESIRTLAASCNRSYGFVRRGWEEEDANFRGRAGVNRTPRNTGQSND